MVLYLIIAGFSRLIMSFLTFVIARDGTRFIAMARAIGRADYDAIIAEQYHPLYSYLIYAANFLAKDWIVAAKFVSITMGTLTVIPLFFIARRIFNDKIAKITIFLYAIHPYAVRFSADALSETTYIFFLLFAVWAIHSCVTGERKVLMAVLAGFFTGCAYLTRPEGIGVLFAASVFVMLSVSKNKLKRVVILLIILFSFAVVSSPYICLIKNKTGEWRITTKKSIKNFVPKIIKNQIFGTLLYAENIDSIESSKRENTKIENFKKTMSMLNTFVKTCHPALLIFLLIGIFFCRKKLRRDQKMMVYILFVLSGLYFYILYKLSLSHYISKRHALPIVMLLLPFVGGGIDFICSLSERFKSKFLWIILLILSIILATKTFKPQRANKRYIRELANWIIINSDAKSGYVVDDARIPFYAKVNFKVMPSQRVNFVDVNEFFLGRYLLVSKDNAETRVADLDKLLKTNKLKLKSIYKYTDSGTVVVEYYLYEYFG